MSSYKAPTELPSDWSHGENTDTKQGLKVLISL